MLVRASSAGCLSVYLDEIKITGRSQCRNMMNKVDLFIQRECKPNSSLIDDNRNVRIADFQGMER